MKIWDVVRSVGPLGESGSAKDFLLDADAQISSIDDSFLKSAPPLLSVINEAKGLTGEVRRDDLSFFVSHCRSWFSDTVMDSLESGIIAADEKGRIFYVNKAYEELLGVPLRKVVGRNIFRIEPESDLCEAIRSRKDIVNPRKHIKSVNRYASIRIRTLYERGKFKGAVSLFTDVTTLETLNTEIERMSGMMDEFRQQLDENRRQSGVITRNRRLLQLLDQAEVAARTDVPVLIRGENGVGKEVVARFIHNASSRSGHPMVVVNCSAIPESLIESELFGYEEGSFTGAKKGGRMGKFELANHGTIFLDEIGDMPTVLQSRLLRVIQNGEIEKIGRQGNVPVDVRIIAATNQPLEDMIRNRTFRKDLFFRLNVISLTIPALRDRREDIPLLADHFLREYAQKYGREKIISAEGYHKLLSHEWSGNVRELQNCIERAVILSTGNELDFRDLDILGESSEKSAERQEANSGEPSMPEFDFPASDSRTLEEALSSWEEAYIRKVMVEVQGDRSEAISRLGLSRRTFYRKCAAYGILRE